MRHPGTRDATLQRVVATVLLSALASGGSLAVVSAQPPAPESAEEGVRDLEAFLEAAEAHYPALEADSFAIDAAQARLDEARFSPFFRWTATAGATVTPSARGTPVFSPDGQLPLDDWGIALGAEVQGAVPLYTFGKLRAAKRAARAGVDAAHHDRDRTLARVRFDVRRAYFGLQLALDIEQMISEGRGQLARAIDKLDAMLAEADPDANPLDRRRLGAALAEIDARASETTRLRRSSEAALRALTGVRAVRIPECPIEPVPLEAEPLQRYLASARSERPEVRLLDAAITAREADLAVQRAGYAPDIALAFRAGYTWTPGRTDQDNPFVYDPANQPSLGAGLVMRWNLDFAGQVFRTRRSEAQLAETRADIAEARLGLDLEVELAFERLEDARRREEAWATGERETRAWFVGAAQAYDIGTVEPRDLIDALKAYFQARFSHLQAVQELNTAVADLERTSGETILPLGRWEPGCE